MRGPCSSNPRRDALRGEQRGAAGVGAVEERLLGKVSEGVRIHRAGKLGPRGRLRVSV